MNTGKWLISRKADLGVLLLPVWICWGFAFGLSEEQLSAEVPVWVVVAVVIGVDVSHVWSTIFRTYLDKEEFRLNRRILILAPVLSFCLAFGLAAFSMDLFWRCLAYVAVYHFVKQQFGFMRIYKAKNRDFRPKIISDNFIIYLSMLYPVLFWHLSPDRNFSWFVTGDFLSLSLPDQSIGPFSTIGNILYFGLIAWWLTDEFLHARSTGHYAAGKILWVLTTALNWFLGIVFFNSDLVFTVTNVVAHGLPYLALIIFYQGGKRKIKTGKVSSSNWIKIGLVVCLVALGLALVEEYLWDALVYRDFTSIFFKQIGYSLNDPALVVQWIAVGALAVPQVTHYILDGYIWKNSDNNPYLKDILLK